MKCSPQTMKLMLMPWLALSAAACVQLKNSGNNPAPAPEGTGAAQGLTDGPCQPGGDPLPRVGAEQLPAPKGNPDTFPCTKGGPGQTPVQSPTQHPLPPPPPPPVKPVPPAPLPPQDGGYDKPPMCQEKAGHCGNDYPGQTPMHPPKDGGFTVPGCLAHFPGVTITGMAYSHDEVAGCMNAFHAGGYDTKGDWKVDVREIKQISILSGGVFEDHGDERQLVIIKNIGVLGHQEYHLFNPNALYCLQGVNVLDHVKVLSCAQGNVVVGSSVQVLGSTQVDMVACHP